MYTMTQRSSSSSDPGRSAESQFHQFFCENVRFRREALGLTQTQLGMMCEIGKSRVSQIERGMDAPTIKTIARLAKALKMHPAMFFARHPGDATFIDSVKIYEYPEE
jgi:transcriptional regulator with XRE-family HTH domain